MQFTDPFDEGVARHGPGAFFTLNHEGELQLEVQKSRDLWRQHLDASFEERTKIAWQHCILTDTKTGWPYYALISSPVLCRHYRQANLECFLSYEEALQTLDDRKRTFYQKNS